MAATLHFIAANRHRLLSPIGWEALASASDAPSKPLSPTGKANKPSRSPERIPVPLKAPSSANSVLGDRDRKGKGKARDVQEYHGEDGQENGWDHARVDEYGEDGGEDKQEVICPFTFRPPVAKPVEYAHLGPPSQYFSFTHIIQTGEDAHNTRVCINREDIHRETGCVEGDRNTDAPVDEATPVVPAPKPTSLPKPKRECATRAPTTSARGPRRPTTQTKRKYTHIREGVFVCSVCGLEMSKRATKKHAPACRATSPYSTCELCGRKSLNHRAESMKRHQRTKKCHRQRLAYAVALVPRWSPTPRIAAWERNSLASNAPYRFARGTGAAREEDGGEDDEDAWVYSDSSDEEDGLDGVAQGYYWVDGDVYEQLEDEDEGAGGDRYGELANDDSEEEGRDEGVAGDGDAQEHEDPYARDEGAWGEDWCGELENECTAGPSSVTLEDLRRQERGSKAAAERSQSGREQGWIAF
ncbi:C2H2-type domain-containing protein [Pleurotus pulmonarius]